MYYSHIQDIIKLEMEAHLNTAFKHFYLFIKEFNLVEAKEMAPLETIIETFERQLKEYDAKKANV